MAVAPPVALMGFGLVAYAYFALTMAHVVFDFSLVSRPCRLVGPLFPRVLSAPTAASVTDFCSGVDSYEALLFEHLVHSICITYPLLHAMLGTIERESYYRHAIAVLLWIVDTRSAFALLGGLGVLSPTALSMSTPRGLRRTG
jgi:hypothetical protein